MREKVGKSRNTVFCQWFVAPEGRKVGSLKRGVRSQLARWVMKNCTPLWREVKMYKTPRRRTTFGSCDVEKVHAIVARSTFPSENVQSTPWSDHFWKLSCRKSARRCGAKHIWKSKCTLDHIYIHAYIHTYMHAYIHTYTHTYIHIHTCVRFAYAYTYCTHIHIHVHVHVHIRIHIHIHKYIYIYIYTYTYIYIHIYTYTYIYIFQTTKNNLSHSTSPMFPSRLVLAPIFPCLAFVHQPLRLKLTPIYSGIQPSHGVTQKCKLRKLLSSGLQQVE